MPLSNVLIIKVLIVPIIHLLYYFSTAVTSILNCLFSIFFSICVIFVFYLCFCAGCIKVLVLLYMHLNKYLMNWYFLSNNIRNSNIILISLLCYVSSSKNIRRKSLRRYMYIYIYIYIHTHTKLYHVLNFFWTYLNLDTAMCLYFDPDYQHFALHIT